MSKNNIVVLISLALVAACASAPHPVPIEGSHESLASLAGEWTGSYAGHESGRSGSIIFVLEADAESASGDVLMIPRHLYRRSEKGEIGDADPRVNWPEPIGIRFVHADARGLFGQLDAYRDPECGCRLETTFVGSLTGDRIEGTFETRHVDGGERHSGTWHVERSGP